MADPILSNTDAIAKLAVKDLRKARDFYEGVLGFAKVDEEGEEVVSYGSGKTAFNVYRSEYAGSNKATAVTWAVGDRVDEIAKALKARGVSFERYDMPETTLEGDVHVMGDMRVAWFKDPDGNILNIVNR